MKQLSEFQEIDDGKAELTLMAYALTPKEQKEALEELRTLKVHITAIEADVVNGKITADYQEVVYVMNELEKKGWVWDEREAEQLKDVLVEAHEPDCECGECTGEDRALELMEKGIVEAETNYRE